MDGVRCSLLWLMLLLQLAANSDVYMLLLIAPSDELSIT